MAGIGTATIYVCMVSFSLLMLGLYIIGAARYLADVEENTCDMTYMFEYPQYVKVALDEELEERYPRYGLYAYGEGFVTQKLRRMKFSGIPVLFVPGNSGSHEQARSLASVSLRKSIKDRTSFHFDYFTVSLGKDYSALFGGVLEDETAYVSLCIRQILSLYKGKVDKLVLIGHSMGGIIAKGALLRPISPDANGRASNSSAASILVTLASPHRPIFLPDRTIARYYEELERSTRRLEEMETTVVSIGGGKRDVLVGSSQIIDTSADLNLLTSGIPEVWRSTDHLCILWCKQLILTIVRALFDCVDRNARPPAITSDSDHKLRALGYHLANRFSGKKMQPYEEKQEFNHGAKWIEDIRRQYTWTSGSKYSNKTVFLLIRLDSPSYDSLSLETTNLDAKDWLFVCSAYAIEENSRVCKWGWNLTNRTSLSTDSTKKLNHLDLKDLRDSKLSHLAVRIPASNENSRGKKNLVKIHVDLYRDSDRTVQLEDVAGGSGGFLNIFRLSSILTPNPHGTVAISQGSLVHRVLLNGIADAVSIEIEYLNEIDDPTATRSKSSSDDRDNPRAMLELLQEPNRHGVSGRQVRPIIFKDAVGGATGRRERAVMHPAGHSGILTVSLGPEYAYRMTIRRAGIVERVACSVRGRWPTLYPTIMALCLHGVAMRIDNSPRKTAITVTVTLLIGLVFDRVFETFVAMGLVHVFAVTTFCLVVFFGSVARNIAARFVARIVALPNLWFDWLLGGLDRVPILTTFLLLSLISATCGAIAMLLSVALFFLKFTRMYDEFVEELLMASLRQFIPFSRRMRKRKRRENSGMVDSTSAVASAASAPAQPGDGQLLNSSTITETTAAPTTPSVSKRKTLRESILDTLLLFVTWSFAAIPALPSALVWAKNFRYETRLTTEDPTMLFSWLVLTGWASLGYVDLPSSQPDSCSKLGRLFCGTVLRKAAFALLCTAGLDNSAHYQWIVPPLVALCVTCVALLSLFPGSSAPDKSPAAVGDAAQRVDQ